MCRGGHSYASFSRMTSLVNRPPRTHIIALKGKRDWKFSFAAVGPSMGLKDRFKFQ
jgi:hypothetical protein